MHRFRFLNTQVSKKNGSFRTIIEGKKHFTFVLLLSGEFKCLLSRLQQEISTKTEYREIDPNRSWELKADSHLFLICIGGAEIKHVLVGVLTDKLQTRIL